MGRDAHGIGATQMLAKAVRRQRQEIAAVSVAPDIPAFSDLSRIVPGLAFRESNGAAKAQGARSCS